MKRTRRLLGSSCAFLAMFTLLAGTVNGCQERDDVEATADADPGVGSTRVGEAAANITGTQELPSLLTALDSLPESARRALEPPAARRLAVVYMVP